MCDLHAAKIETFGTNSQGLILPRVASSRPPVLPLIKFSSKSGDD